MTDYITIKFTLRGICDYSQSKYLDTHANPDLAKRDKEDDAQREARIWKAKMHTVNGHLAVPALSVKAAFVSASKKLGIKIPGKGKQTYTHAIQSSMLPMSDLFETNIPVAQVEGVTLPQNSRGEKGSGGAGKMVLRTFPIVRAGWECECEFSIYDEGVTKEVMHKVMQYAGTQIGIGRWRPENGGMNGRFVTEITEWTEHSAFDSIAAE